MKYCTAQDAAEAIRHNEDNRHAHAERGVGLLGYAEERAAAEELNENVVVDQDCRDCERQISVKPIEAGK